MTRRPRPAALQTGMLLDTITIRIVPGGWQQPPVVELAGRSVTGNPRVDALSRVTVTTTHLPPEGHRFIELMQQQFSKGEA